MTRPFVRRMIAAICIGVLALIAVVAVVSYPPGREQQTTNFRRGSLAPLATIPVTETVYPARAVRCIELLGLSHRPMDGTHLVVTHLTISDPSLFTSDDEEFEIVSLEIPDNLVGQRVVLPSAELRVRYSIGRLYGTHRCVGRIATEASGIVTTKMVGNSLSVFLELELALQEVGHHAESVSMRVHRDFRAEERVSGDVTDIFDELLQHVEPEAGENRSK